MGAHVSNWPHGRRDSGAPAIFADHFPHYANLEPGPDPPAESLRVFGKQLPTPSPKSLRFSGAFLGQPERGTYFKSNTYASKLRIYLLP